MTQSPGTLRQNPLFPWLIVLAVIVVIVLAMFFKRGGQEPAPAQAHQPTSPAPAPTSRARPGFRIPTQAMSNDAVRQRRVVLTEKRRRVQQNVDRTQATFAARYNREPVDAAWAGAKEAELTQLAVSDQIRQLGVEAQNLAVDCKSSMCRITGDFPSTSAGDDWITLYMTNVGGKVPMASYKYVQNPDGTVSINVYAMGRK